MLTKTVSLIVSSPKTVFDILSQQNITSENKASILTEIATIPPLQLTDIQHAFTLLCTRKAPYPDIHLEVLTACISALATPLKLYNIMEFHRSSIQNLYTPFKSETKLQHFIHECCRHTHLFSIDEKTILTQWLKNISSTHPLINTTRTIALLWTRSIKEDDTETEIDSTSSEKHNPPKRCRSESISIQDLELLLKNPIAK